MEYGSLLTCPPFAALSHEGYGRRRCAGGGGGAGGRGERGRLSMLCELRLRCLAEDGRRPFTLGASAFFFLCVLLFPSFWCCIAAAAAAAGRAERCNCGALEIEACACAEREGGRAEESGRWFEGLVGVTWRSAIAFQC